MRRLSILSVVLLTTATPASSQVTVDLHALQALPDHNTGGRSPPRPPKPSPEKPAIVTRVAPLPMVSPPQVTQPSPMETPPVPPEPSPALPDSVPDVATINPVVPPAEPPPAPPPVSDSAATVATQAAAGLRLTFAPGQSDLSPESAASIKELTAAAPPTDSTTFSVLAYAPGKPDDPSTARRVSLSRAMAVRSALVADGVPSARIVVRALGEQGGDGPPDRVDIGVSGANPPPGTAPSR